MTKLPTVGAVIDQIWSVREVKRGLEAQLKETEIKVKELEDALTDRLEAEGLEKATGSKATASITMSVVADVTDWDKLYPYIAKMKYWHLLQKRVSDPGFRELWDQGKKPPGVVPFTKRKLNLRSL